MKSNKEYRLTTNPMEKTFHDSFKEKFGKDPDTLSAIIHGWKDDSQDIPVKELTTEEQSICLNMIQWLGSPVGQRFLDDIKTSQMNTDTPTDDKDTPQVSTVKPNMRPFLWRLLLAQTFLFGLIFGIPMDGLTPDGVRLFGPIVMIGYVLSVLITFIIPMVKSYTDPKQ
jgi:hypothetical protein